MEHASVTITANESADAWPRVQAVVENLTTISLALNKGRGAAPTPPVTHRSLSVLPQRPAALEVSPKLLSAAERSAVPAPAVEGKLVMGRISGDIGVPMYTRTPGDLWVLGAGLAGGVEGLAASPSPSLSSSRDKPLFSPSVPRLLQEAKQLDVVKVWPPALGSSRAPAVAGLVCGTNSKFRPG